MAKSLEEIRQDYNMGNYSYRVEIPNKLPETHVFDENLSVKENRRMVADHNQHVENMRKEKQKRNAELSNQLTRDVIAYIVDNYELTEAQAAIVERYVYIEKHAFMGDYFSAIDSMAEFAENIALTPKPAN